MRDAEDDEAQHQKERRVLVDDVVGREKEDIERPEQQKRAERKQERPEHLAQQIAVENGQAHKRPNGRAGSGCRCGQRRHARRPTALVAAVRVEHARDVRARLRIRRHAVIAVDRTGAGIVRGDGERTLL